jgi:2-polyprenyl-3-methyl-5-hydroxy-6-metoxy-1,4-benzoquinol methylase
MSELWTARDEGELIGYAIALKGISGSNEKIIWVTQFVIHTKYRNIGIGKRLLFSIWGFSSFFAWGLVTANPFAVRALEKATRRRCEPVRIRKNSQQLLNFGKSHVNYINNETEKCVSDSMSKINTKFFVDHSDLESMLTKTSDENKPWLLGNIEEGWEWFAFTFNDQLPIELTASEIEVMLNASDSIAQEAYSRMPMGSETHKWTYFTSIEVDYIISQCNLSYQDKILDVGCGMGRHTIELCKRGFNSHGIDYTYGLIESAISKAKEENVNAIFSLGDLSSPTFEIESSKYDCVICLYDVIGTYADNFKNIQILKNISKLLKEGGYAIISVMNLHLTESIAKHKFSLINSSKELLALSASDTMETTGNIFNPDYYLIDEDTKIVYRKEVFSSGDSFPKELIVRDRRYYMDEIVKMCSEVGLAVISKRFVSAGWQNDYDFTHNKAKEILLTCIKNKSK